MVDTPKQDDGDNIKDPVEDKLPKKLSKHRRQRRRSKSRHGKNSVPAQERIALRTMPETMKTPPSQVPNRLDRKMGESALMNRLGTATQRIATTCLSPRMR